MGLNGEVDGRVHAGQGTANRRVIFEENLFEMIYLTSEEEARSNVLRLDQDGNVLRHSLGSTRIESLIALVPGAQWPLVEKVEGVRFESALRPHLHLHIDGNAKCNFAINELCSFAVPSERLLL